MKLNGIHHITAITADAPGNVAFYAGVLGLRLVKKTVNQDDPTVYHLFYGDDQGTPGLDLTFFEYPRARRGHPGAGMVHQINWRVGSAEALDFWAERLGAAEVAVARRGEALRFADPEGLAHLLVLDRSGDAPLLADHPEVPAEVALRGFDGVRAFAFDPDASAAMLDEVLGFHRGGDRWESRGPDRGSTYTLDRAQAPGRMGAGVVHHVAWSSTMDDHDEWQRRVAGGGLRPTPVIDRFWFRSIYFREPSGVLFEIATLGPGFGVDEDPEHLGEALVLPPDFEHLRDQLEHVLTPLPVVRRPVVP
jgi:glyoxalase family protein